jgi:uncharacterized protein YoaH (UPF0181 family)
MSSGKAIAKVSAAIAALRKMTNWLRKGSDTLVECQAEIDG